MNFLLTILLGASLVPFAVSGISNEECDRLLEDYGKQSQWRKFPDLSIRPYSEDFELFGRIGMIGYRKSQLPIDIGYPYPEITISDNKTLQLLYIIIEDGIIPNGGKILQLIFFSEDPQPYQRERVHINIPLFSNDKIAEDEDFGNLINGVLELVLIDPLLLPHDWLKSENFQVMKEDSRNEYIAQCRSLSSELVQKLARKIP